ncbi:MAG: hypothetical protein GY756_00630, partial [bacterium]|nr:hypothetical protein [bacterium]
MGSDHKAKFDKLFKENHNIDLRDNKGNTLLHCAAGGKNIEIMKFLIDSGINIKATNQSGDTVLHCRNWTTTEPIKILIENGADVNAKGKFEITPLQYYLLTLRFRTHNLFEFTKTFVDGGSDVNAINNHPRIKSTILQLVIGTGNYEAYDTAKYLLENGADANAKAEGGRTPLEAAKNVPLNKKMKKL